jgi:hypothetical protein
MPSRSPFAYERRKQLRSLHWPSPTFAPGQLLVHQYPDPTGKPIAELVVGEGAPPPDRVMLNDWSPPPQEETGG